MAHALLSPSAASRWLVCTKSARLEEMFENRSSDAADEGTLAHAVGELIIKHKLQWITKQKFNVELKMLQKPKYYNKDLYNYANDYALFVMEAFAEALRIDPNAQIFLESKADLSAYVPESFGTRDVAIVFAGIVWIIDLKYGKGVKVDAEDNKQLRLYALGTYDEFNFLYSIHTIRMSIYQPRMENISTTEIKVEELLEWGESTVKPNALKAFNGEGDYVPGEHCRFCRAKATCRARAERSLDLEKYDFRQADLLTDDELADVLLKGPDLVSWVNAVQEYAQFEAVKNDRQWPGFKLVEGKSNRTYTNEDTVAEKLLSNGYSENQIFTKKIIGITKMEQLLTKPKTEELLKGLIIKPEGKPTLVREIDKRPALKSIEHKQEVIDRMFAEINVDE